MGGDDHEEQHKIMLDHVA